MAFGGKNSGGRMARIHVHSLEEGDGDRTRCAKSIDGLCVLYHFRATSFNDFHPKPSFWLRMALELCNR